MQALESPRQSPGLRLCEDGPRPEASAPRALRAWILLFASLSTSGGHGVFLACALTRLEKLPALSELGGPLEIAVIGWFVACAPLAAVAVALRGWLCARARVLRGAAGASALATAAAFAVYLRAIALG